MKNLNVFSISLLFYIFLICCIYEINSQNVTLKGLLKSIVTPKSGSVNGNDLKFINEHYRVDKNNKTSANQVKNIGSRALRIKRPAKPLYFKRNDNVKRYSDFEDIIEQKNSRYYTDIWNPTQQTFGYENFFLHPSRASTGKLFNQGDIDDIYLNGNHEYKKLVKDYNKQIFHPVFRTKDSTGDISRIKSENIFGTAGNRQKIFHSAIGIDNFKKKNFDNDGYKAFDNKKFGFSKSNGFESLRNSYGDLIGDAGGWTPEKLPDSIFNQDGLYGQKLGFKTGYDPEKFYNLDTESSAETTLSPFASFSTSYPLKNYASNFNLDTKPYPNIESTKFITPYDSGKYSFKNTGLVSVFDLKGYPLGYSSTISPVTHSSKAEFDTNKEATSDFEKAFYDLNKPTSAGSSFNFANVQPSESTAASNVHVGSNKGYASIFGYQPQESQVSSSADSVLKNFDFNKYNNYLAYHKDVQYTGPRSPVEISHPIIIPVPHPYPVKVPIAKPVAVPILKEIQVPIEKVVPYPVFKKIPYPIEKRIPVPVEKQVSVPVPRPYPVKIPVIKNIYHHSRDHDIPGISSGHKFRGKEHQKNPQRENWDYEPEPQHSHRETWEEGGRFNKNAHRNNWGDDSDHKESLHNEHWEHEQDHNSHRDNWEDSDPKPPHGDNWEHEDRHKVPHKDYWGHEERRQVPHKDYWDYEDNHKNPQRVNGEDESRYKNSHRESWEHESRYKPAYDHSWDEEPKRRPPKIQAWQKPTIRKPIQQSTWEHESYKSSHQHRSRERHRDHHRP